MKEKLTKSDVEKIKKEIEYRTHVVRKEALEDVKTQRAHGDLSENFEYKEAKRFKNRNDGRIRYLQKLLKEAEIIETIYKEDVAQVNDYLIIRYTDTLEEEKIKLVTSIREDSLKGLISIESPLGKALLERRKKEEVLVNVNENVSYSVVIEEIIKSKDENEPISTY